MSGTMRDEPMFSDERIVELARSVEMHDFERIAPPAQVWDNILAGFEEETASSEAEARRVGTAWWRAPRILAAAAAALLMVGVVAAVASFPSDGDDFTEVAAAAMTDADLPVPTAETAVARFVCDGNECAVDVDLTGLPDAGADADLELWVINGDVSDMHSLGFVTDDGRFTLPDGVSHEDFPIVDISIEPRDGDATHSGKSVLRGVFEASS